MRTRTEARIGRVVFLLAIDLAALLAASAAAYLLWADPVRGQPARVYLSLLQLLPLFPIAYATWGLYPGFGLGAVELLRRLTLASSFIFLVLAAFSFVFRVPHHYSRGSFIIAVCLTLLLAPVSRLAALSVARHWHWWPERVLLIGDGELAQRTIRSLRNARSLGYRPTGILVPSRGRHLPQPAIEGVPVVGSLADAEAFRRGVRVILVAADTNQVSEHDLNGLQRDFRHVIWIRSQGTARVEAVGVRNLGQVLGIEYVNQLLRRRNRWLKRTLDVSLGFIALLLVSPLIGLAALVVRLADHGPGFFYQERRGLYGRSIRVWKIRTMYRDADARLENHLRRDPVARREWEERCKLRNDPRILPGIGWLLRRFSVDELPQLWNVIRGDMSLVGPRPFPAYHLENFSDDFQELRQLVRPGLTGLWQVMSRSEGTFDEQEEHDTYYIWNWSLWLDLYLIGKTSLAIVTGRGAY